MQASGLPHDKVVRTKIQGCDSAHAVTSGMDRITVTLSEQMPCPFLCKSIDDTEPML